MCCRYAVTHLVPSITCRCAEALKLNPMNRAEAIKKLVEHQVLECSAKERSTIIECCFLEYDSDEEFVVFDDSLRAELLSGDIKGNLKDKRYDPIVVESLIYDYEGVKNSYIIDNLSACGITVSAIAGAPTVMESCPCCGFQTLSEKGSYDICAVCFWEDDGVLEPEKHSGPNHMTLAEGQANFKKYGACDEKSLEYIDKDGPLKFAKACT